MSNVNELMKQLEDAKKQIKMIEKQLEEAKALDTGYKTDTEGKHYYICDMGDIEESRGTIVSDLNNVTAFTTREKAEQVNNHQLLFRKLDKFSLENGGKEIDWDNLEQNKYHINYSYYDNGFEVDFYRNTRHQGQVNFISREVCEKAIELFKTELLEYFKS